MSPEKFISEERTEAAAVKEHRAFVPFVEFWEETNESNTNHAMQQSLKHILSDSPWGKQPKKTDLDSWRGIEKRGIELKAICNDVLRDFAP